MWWGSFSGMERWQWSSACPRRNSPWLWREKVCCVRGSGKEKETGYSAQHLIWLCNSTAVCSWGVFLTSPKITEGTKPLHVLCVPGSPDKLLAKQSTSPQSPFGVLMPVESVVGSRNNFLAFVADCDQKKSQLSWPAMMPRLCAGWRMQPVVFPWCLGSLERDFIGTKVHLNLPWDLVEFRGL